MIGSWQERKHPRFRLECPVCISFKAGGFAAEVEAVSKDVGIGGFLVRSAAMIPQHTSVRFIISVLEKQSGRLIYMAGEGEVVRVEHSRGDAMFSIAVECKYPMVQLEEPRTLV